MTWHFLQRWHRRFGVMIALIVLVLIVTGVLLNHTTGLRLDSRYVTWEWLLDWYDIQPQSAPVSYRIGNDNITQMGDRLYFNTQQVRESVGRLHGVVAPPSLYIVGADSQLLILDRQGQLQDLLDGIDGVPSGMRRLGLDAEGQIIIRAAHGDYRLDLDRIDWEEEDEIAAEWSAPTVIDADLERALLEQYRGHGLPVERVLLDLHSGRILGQWGVWLIDLVALLLLILAVSGTWMWIHRR